MYVRTGHAQFPGPGTRRASWSPSEIPKPNLDTVYEHSPQGAFSLRPRQYGSSPDIFRAEDQILQSLQGPLSQTIPRLDAQPLQTQFLQHHDSASRSSSQDTQGVGQSLQNPLSQQHQSSRRQSTQIPSASEQLLKSPFSQQQDSTHFGDSKDTSVADEPVSPVLLAFSRKSLLIPEQSKDIARVEEQSPQSPSSHQHHSTHHDESIRHSTHHTHHSTHHSTSGNLQHASHTLDPERRPLRTLKEVQHTVDVLSDAFGGKDDRRRISIRSLLGMLCSHSQQIVLLALSTKEVLVRRVVAILLGNTTDVERANVFQAWAKATIDARREKRIELVMAKAGYKYEIRVVFLGWHAQFVKDRSKRSRRKRTDTFIHESASAAKQDVFEAWQKSLANSKKHMQHATKLLETLIGNERSLAEHAIFSAWHQTAAQSILKMTAMKKNMSLMLGMQDQFFLEHSFIEWGKLARETREKLREQGRFLKIFGDQSKWVVYKEAWDAWLKFHEGMQNDLKQARKVLGLCLGNQASLVIRSNFQAWFGVVRDEQRIRMKEAHDKAVADLADSARIAMEAKETKMREQRIQNLRRAFQKMAGEAEQVLLSNCFSGWWQPILFIKKERKAAAKLLLGNKQMILTSSLIAWSKLASTMRHRREGGLQKAALRLTSDSKLLIMNVLACWLRFLDLCQNEKRKKEREEVVARSVMMNIAKDSNFVISNAFKLWARSVDEMRQERQKGMKMIQLMMGTQGKASLGMAFGGWLDALKTLRSERKIAEEKRRNSVTMNSCQRMIVAQLSKNTSMAASECFERWNLYMNVVRTEVALKKLNAAELRESINNSTAAQRQERQFKKTVMVCWILETYQAATAGRRRVPHRHLLRHIHALRNIQEKLFDGTSCLVLIFALTAWHGWSYAARADLKCQILEGQMDNLERREPGRLRSPGPDLESSLHNRTAEWNQANYQLSHAVHQCAEGRKDRESLPHAELEGMAWRAASTQSVLTLTELELASRCVADRCTQIAHINARLIPSSSPDSLSSFDSRIDLSTHPHHRRLHHHNHHDKNLRNEDP